MESILSKEIRSLKKKTWIPVTEDGDGEIFESKFSGIPLLTEGESWPHCKYCGKPMMFFLQINLDVIPEELKAEWNMREGILQMFYCTEEEASGSENKNGENMLIRILDNSGKPSADIKIPEGLTLFPPKKIIEWKESFDYPIFNELEYLGIKPRIDTDADITIEMLEECGFDDYDPEDIKEGALDEGEHYDIVWEVLNEIIKRPLSGEKLGGWPLWVQEVNYPTCPVCGNKMRFLLQIDSNKTLPYVFGDYGCGHITQCSEHNSVLAFTWEGC